MVEQSQDLNEVRGKRSRSRVEVHRSTILDLPFIMGELQAFAKFFGTKRFLFPKDPATALSIVKKILVDHLFFTSFNDGQPSGFIAGFVTPHPFNPEIIQLTETFWWVAEDFRGSRAGALLLDAFVDWGKRNVDWISMTLEHESPVSCGPLLKRGFRPKESNFLLECDAWRQ